jgi:2-oxoisovalerate dehydrogenase E1 component
MSRAQLLDAYRRMAIIRRMEERVSTLHRDGLIPGTPYAAVLEREWRAGPADIVRTVREVVAC